MKNNRPKEPLERGAASDLWRKTLSRIPSVFGRLAYLSSLRNPNSGKYEHHGLSLVFGDEEAERALLASHEQSFQEWLSFPLQKQKEDLDLHLSSLPEEKAQILDAWLRLAPYRNMIPSTAGGTERKLYLADLEALLGLLKNEFGVSGPDPDA